jgi:S-adenosylhomocysteine hydrolase
MELNMAKHPPFIETLPLLKWVVEEWSKPTKKPLKDIRIFLIIHLLPDASAFLHALKLLGGEKITIIGKPYSTMAQTVREIKDIGFNAIYTPRDMYQFNKYVKDNLIEIFQGKENIIILEDGGYCVKYIIESELNTNKLLGIVEQTTIGINRDKEIIDALKKQKKEINFPIIDVATTKSKVELESIEIGNSVVRNIENLLNKMKKTIAGKQILIVGFGNIGSAIAGTIKDKAPVTIYDNDPLRRIKARYRGLHVEKINQALKKADLVIGCTAKTWAKEKELLNLKDEVIFVCASSERVEYSHESLEKLSQSIKENNWGLKVVLNKKIINLLANGYPVNFFGASAKESVLNSSVPEESFQIISALLLWGLLIIPQNRKKHNIIEFPIKDELRIDTIFEQLLSKSKD